MYISQKTVSALLETIRQVNEFNTDQLDNTAIYRHLASLSKQSERLVKEIRDAVTTIYDELIALDCTPPAIAMESPPDVTISVDEPDIRISMDGILPFPLTGSVYYLHEKLDACLTRYREENRIPRLLFTERCAVVFLHHYRVGTRRDIRDYDNLERRCILNVLARHFLRDDSPRCMLTMDVLAPGESDYTEVRIMTIPRFRAFVMSENIEYEG